MVVPQIQRDLQHQLAGMSAEKQQKVLDFARSLNKEPPKGVSGASLLPFVGSIPHDDLELMKAAIEADCERIEDDLPRFSS